MLGHGGCKGEGKNEKEGSRNGSQTYLEAAHRARRARQPGPAGPAGLGLRVPEAAQGALTDASHVRNALARFDQVEDVSDADRDLAFANIRKAAEHYDVDVEESSWHDLGKRPHTKNPAH